MCLHSTGLANVSLRENNVSDRTKGSIVIAKLGICVKTGSLQTAKRALLELPDTVLKAGQTRSVNRFCHSHYTVSASVLVICRSDSRLGQKTA